MNKISILVLAGLLNAAMSLGAMDTNDTRHAQCEDCVCGVNCRCEENIRKTASVIALEDLAQLDTSIATNQRVIVKFYVGKCPACSFGSYFTELVQDAENIDALFIAFNATAVQDDVKGLYGLPSLPAIVLFVGGQQQAVLKI